MTSCTRPALVLVLTLAAAACGGAGEPAGGDAAAKSPAEPPEASAAADNPCAILSAAEVSTILGVKVGEPEAEDAQTCRYPFDKPAKAPGSGQGIAGELKAPANDREAEEMAKSLASAFASGPPQLVVQVDRTDAATTIAATRMTASMTGGFEQLSDIGDEAWLGPMASTLTFRKGDVAVTLDLRMVPDGRDKGQQLAKLIASRLP
jgi:hypothetical protein